jgi:hypothetical protein
LAAIGLDGCSSGGGAPSAATTSTVPKTTTTAPAPATSTTATTGAASSADFASAKSEWEQGASAISADQGSYLDQAATDLGDAIAAGGNTSGYQMAVQELQQLASLPETGDTAAQMAEAQNDIGNLNTFFGTSGLYE